MPCFYVRHPAYCATILLAVCLTVQACLNCNCAVSYTHLDVYKRQQYGCEMTGEEQIYLALQLKQAGSFTDMTQNNKK